jgi:deazaflavin-dependent oxidoreductase (nitroreductase family)
VDKRRVTRALGKYGVNPVVKVIAGYVPWWSLLETIGRNSGKPRRNPVGNGLKGDTFWIVSEHGRQAGYVKNIEANPRVRLRVGGRWRHGTARVLKDDDARKRQRQLGTINSAFVRLMGTDLVTVRIDLED